MNDVLAGKAGNVRAGPTDPAPLDDRNFPPFAGKSPGEKLTGLAAPEHEKVNFFNRRWGCEVFGRRKCVIGHELTPCGGDVSGARHPQDRESARG
jgi:hypothetical protein